MIRLALLLAMVLCSSNALLGQNDIFGKWKTIDDSSGKPRSIVEIYNKNGMAHGRILQLFREPGEDPDPLCDVCEGDKNNQRVIGMEIITDMSKNGDEWSGGEILDPDNGKNYRCKIWVEDGQLKVRGYIAIFYRTQTWVKAQ